MSLSRPIAVLGASGRTGRAVVRQLLVSGFHHLDFGVSDLGVAGEIFGHLLSGPISLREVVEGDEVALRRLCEDARAVVNCAGPRHLVGDRIASAAWRAGAHHIDVGGGDRARRALSDFGPRSDLCAVFAASAIPGVGGLLARTLLDAVDNRRFAVSVHVAGSGRLSRAEAVDLLDAEGIPYTHSLADPLFGRSLAHSPGGVRTLRVAGLERHFHVLPFLPEELRGLADDHGIGRFLHHLALPTERVQSALAAWWSGSSLDVESAADRLCLATAADAEEHGTWCTVTAERLDLERPWETARRIAVQGAGPAELTALMTVAALRGVLRGAVPLGVHSAADVVDPVDLFEVLETSRHCRTAAMSTSDIRSF